MPRVSRASCGKIAHGKGAAPGKIGLCYGCGRPGGRDGCASKWDHMGSTEHWAELHQWAAQVGGGWLHDRDLERDPLQAGGCICRRPDCAAGLYQKFKNRRQKEEIGSLFNMEVGQRSPLGRYPSTGFQVRALLEHVHVEGGVLDCCGSTQDAVSTVLTARGFRVATNDINPRLVADTHLDAATDALAETYREDARRPDWIVTSPPYNNVLSILKQALRLGRKGVAFKLMLTFLEPTKSRGRWLKDNPPDRIVVMPRATYRGRKCSSAEAWFVWETSEGQKERTRPAFSFALPT